ncbi:hypothetical protein GCM10018966_026420 [Streptomyces yanii]
MPWPCTSPHPGAIYKNIAADLGVNRATLREWVRSLGFVSVNGVTVAGSPGVAWTYWSVSHLSGSPDVLPLL